MFFKKHWWLWVYLAVYTAVNLLFLQQFPFVHSDEPWLSGLTRNMMDRGSLSVTEPFFDLFPRNPHAIKTLFHLLQMIPLKLFGYHIFSFRILSLAAGIACLSIFYFLARRLLGNTFLAMLAVAVLSADVQFLYTAHFARPDIMILLALLTCFALLNLGRRRAGLYAALITGASIGIHPNGFLVACMCGFILLANCLSEKKIRWKRLAVYTGVTTGFAAFFVGLSLYFDRNFFQHYLAYGEQFGVNSSLGDKIWETGPYFQRLFQQISGTYYTPDIRFQLILFLLVLAVSIPLCIGKRRRELLVPLAALAGIWAGMVLVGRFNQPYVIFLFPFFYLLAARIPRTAYAKASMAVLCVVVAVLSVLQIIPVSTQPYQYSRYLEEIASAVPPGSKTIGNLNAEYYFDNGALMDYRNLPLLEENGLTLEQYVRDNGVEYLIISDELYILYERRPNYNNIYGNINFLTQLEDLLQDCTLVHSFTDNQYGIRAVGLQDYTGDCTVRIYRYDPVFNTHSEYSP